MECLRVSWLTGLTLTSQSEGVPKWSGGKAPKNMSRVPSRCRVLVDRQEAQLLQQAECDELQTRNRPKIQPSRRGFSTLPDHERVNRDFSGLGELTVCGDGTRTRLTAAERAAEERSAVQQVTEKRR